MKSKKKQRILALILSMVLMLSASISALAEGDVQTEASGTETTENQAAVQSLEQETVPETEVTTEEGGIDTQSAETSTEPVQENTEQEVTETPAEPEQGVTEETAETTDTTQSQAQSTEVQEESDAAEEIPVEEQPGETTEETATEETVVSEAAELKQEFTDENGNVTQTVTAYVPEGAFQATADQISMEVSLLNTDDTNYIKGMMEELLPENYYLDGYVLYQIDFKVNGEITQPAKAVTITMNGNDLAVEDIQKAHVFYYDAADPEVEEDKDQLVEVTQKDQLIKSLEESGESTENIEDYDYSEIAVNEGNADTITVKGWKSTIYGCYVEKEAVTELTYEDDSVTVTVSADQAGIIPDGAELSVTPITKTEITDDMSKEEKAQAEEINVQYDFTEEQLQKDSEENDTTMEGFLAYDICFLVDGEEVEPSGDVKVVIDFKEAAVPEGVSEDAEVTVKHLKEDESAEDGVVVEDMTEAASVETTEAAEVQKVELVAESFSIYTIQWTYYGDYRDDDYTFKVNVVDTFGNSIGSEDNVTYPGSSAAVEDIVAVLGLDLQKWKFEYATTNNYRNNDRITAFRLSSGNTQYRLEGESDYPHTAGGNTEFYFVFSDRPAIETITTEDTISKGITINLFDYQVGPDGEESTESSGLNRGINQGNDFKFVSDRKDANGSYNQGGGINQDIILPLLGNGYPVLKNNDGSLDYLFNGNSSNNVKQAYLDLNNLFVLDDAGYYSYDSNLNYAYLDKSKGTFEVYNQPGSGFFPFTTQEHMFDAKAVQDNAVIGGDGMNHYFGMTVESTFIQPNNGRITYVNEDSNETTEDMVFEFRGDDDVWVFIDGVLVMDLGGIHSPIEGSINFATGVVTEDGKTTSIYERFKTAGVENLEDIFESNGNGDFRFTDYSDHEIKFFYLERGNDQANCKIRFNLQTIPNDSLLVTKEVTDKDNNDLDYVEDIDFMFQILKDEEEWSNATYDLYEGNVLITENLEVKDKGYFTLKHGQSALFKFDPDSDQTFEIKEEGAYLNGYEVTCNGGDITLTPVEGTETTLPSESTGEQNISDISSVLFQNEITETATLSIEKVMEDTQAATEGLSFAMNVKIGGELYEGTYKINDVEHETDPQKPGVIVLEPGQTATITGLPYGTRFEVWEGTTTGYSPTYLINGECYNPSLPEFDEETGESNGVYTASASISGDSIVTVKNSKNPFAEGSTDVNVKKEWENQSSYDLPEWVKVTLYEDTNKDGKYSEGDTIVSGKEVLELNAENSWSDGWENLPGDIDYVVREEFPPGYKLVTSSFTNEIDSANLLRRVETCRNTSWMLGRNNMLITKKGSEYILWTLTDLNIDTTDTEFRNMLKNILGSGSINSLTYIYGQEGFEHSGVTVTPFNNGQYRLDFSATSDWSMFWLLTYERTENITLKNTIKEDEKINIEVKKEWSDNNPQGYLVQIQLQRNNQDYGETITLGVDNKWNHIFENLDYYYRQDGKYIPYKYTVKEIAVAKTETDFTSGNLMGYEYVVTGNASEGFTITNTLGEIEVDLQKFGTNYSSPQDGAIFDLYSDTQENNEITWSVEQAGIAVNNSSDVHELKLESGFYKLEETTAPLGFSKLEEPIYFKVDGQNVILTDSQGNNLSNESESNMWKVVTSESGVKTIQIQNKTLYSLPSAGGPGIFLYMIGGTLLLMAGSLMIYINRRRGVLKK